MPYAVVGDALMRWNPRLTIEAGKVLMAYDPNNLSALTYANGFSLWHYKTADALDHVSEDHYFNDAACMLRVGDFILVSSGHRGGIIFVRENYGGAVNTTDLTSPL